jgi:NAD(P)-dependent dehydrogenase (short-subunit alcohol dehydrogenase family)
MGELEGKVAAVTGGGQGIGRAIAQELHGQGARVAVLEIDRENGSEAADELLALRPDSALFVACDVTIEAQVAGAFREISARFGGLDVLVNNAGRNTYYRATTMTEADWDDAMGVDLKSVWLCAKHAIPAMSNGGAIVNIASIHAFVTNTGMFPYAAAKSGVVGLTRVLALDHAAEGIRVNAVCPGWTRTRLVQEWFDRQDDPAAAEQHVFGVHPLGRIGTPKEIAACVSFLASDRASFVTGTTLLVDGGLTARFPG